MDPSTQTQPGHLAKFLINNSGKRKALESQLDSVAPSTSKQENKKEAEFDCSYYELDKVYLGKELEQYYLIPYNLSKLTFFIFIKVTESFKLNVLKRIDEILGSNMVVFLQEIDDQQLKRNQMKYT